MNHIVLSLGSNIGDRAAHFRRAIALLDDADVAVHQASSLYLSEPMGIADQEDFYNQVLIVDTLLEPEELLSACLQIEEDMGRVRSIPNGPRIIDIDVLFYKNEVLDLPNLQLPHPGVPQRKFVLAPLVEIAAEQQHPVLKKTIQELYESCQDPLWVTQIDPGLDS